MHTLPPSLSRKCHGRLLFQLAHHLLNKSSLGSDRSFGTEQHLTVLKYKTTFQYRMV
jgi:hypothetical protein